MGAMIATAVPSARRAAAPRIHLARPEAPEEQDLVALALGGDRKALGELLGRYEKRLFHLALGIVGSRETALDVVQQAMLRVCASLDRFNGASAFSTWVWRITWNCAIDEVRRLRLRGTTSEGEDEFANEDCLATRPLSVSESSEGAVLRNELGRTLQAALRELSENHRAILVLREVEGLSYEEIASVLGIPEGTVMSRLFHARRRMQAALKERGISGS